MPSCARKSEHKEVNKARQERDTKDTEKILKYLDDRNPFSDDPSLHSIATGITADNIVNVTKAKQIGAWIIAEMVDEYKFKKKKKAVTLKAKCCIQFDNEIKV